MARHSHGKGPPTVALLSLRSSHRARADCRLYWEIEVEVQVRLSYLKVLVLCKTLKFNRRRPDYVVHVTRYLQIPITPIRLARLFTLLKENEVAVFRLGRVLCPLSPHWSECPMQCPPPNNGGCQSLSLSLGYSLSPYS